MCVIARLLEQVELPASSRCPLIFWRSFKKSFTFPYTSNASVLHAPPQFVSSWQLQGMQIIVWLIVSVSKKFYFCVSASIQGNLCDLCHLHFMTRKMNLLLMDMIGRKRDCQRLYERMRLMSNSNNAMRTRKLVVTNELPNNYLTIYFSKDKENENFHDLEQRWTTTQTLQG